jgi:3-deoxy-7-phosphoheptulonate synthase
MSLPLGESEREFIVASRQQVQAIIERQDPRYLAVVGPCSIHDLSGARQYAERLSRLAQELKDVFHVVMRVYFEKPRTTIGWKGFINDPRMDDSFCIDEGLYRAREFLIEIASMHLPAGTEALDPITPQYLDDLITWTAIGARTTESQTHREIASGLSTPVGFKNGTDGSIDVAINALQSSRGPHHFLGINQNGQIAILRTAGNKFGHIVLRGGKSPNYDSGNVSLCEKALAAANLPKAIMIDCSHGNSQKDYTRQPLVFEDCVIQILAGNRSIIGMMVESHIFSGKQELTGPKESLQFGVSVTDGCIDWETTEQCLRHAYKRLRPIVKN